MELTEVRSELGLSAFCIRFEGKQRRIEELQFLLRRCLEKGTPLRINQLN